MPILTGQYSTNAKGEKTFEIPEAPPQILPIIAGLLQSEFGFIPQPVLEGLSVYYLDCVKEDFRITIGWDNWSGCFIRSLSETSENDKIIGEIGTFLSSQFDKLPGSIFE